MNFFRRTGNTFYKICTPLELITFKMRAFLADRIEVYVFLNIFLLKIIQFEMTRNKIYILFKKDVFMKRDLPEYDRTFSEM